MNNHHKIGYSVPEVAQIFGCTPVTIRKYIYNGKLKADVTKNDKANTIRIRREHLVEYMREHKTRFDDELLKRFGVDTDDGKTVKPSDMKDNKSDFAPGAYTVGDISELEGAWGKDKKPNKKANKKASKNTNKKAEPTKSEKKFPTYEIVADGKVVISGCEKLTVGRIVDALIIDRQLEIKEISIKMK